MKGKTIFITGGNDGIGMTTAQLFARQGAKVAIMSRRADKNKTACAVITAEGGQCIAFTGDVAKESDIRHAVEETFKHFGSLHYAFNNAGGPEIPAPLVEKTEAEYYAVFDAHVKGTLLCMKHQIPLIIQSGGGAIVNNASAAGHVGMERMAIYTAAKHAIIGLTQSAALDYRRQNVRVNAVCPGLVEVPHYVDSPLLTPEHKAQIENSIPMGRMGNTDEVARAVLYLCRDASYSTGTSLFVDGGYTVP